MPQFSANLGFLWSNRPLPTAIRAAKSAGFAAVECHWPYETPAAELRAVLEETGLPMLGLNTRRGEGEMGLAALPHRRREAREQIAEALDYAAAIGAEAVHVMAGNSMGYGAHAVFRDSLRFAAERAGEGIVILIEPLNRNDAPDYFLRTTDQAAEIIAEVGAPNLKLMFDCYHVGRSEGDVVTRLKALYPLIGHIQIAAVPDRGPPDHGELDYGVIFSAIDGLGWTRPLGAEYRVEGSMEASLGWMAAAVAATQPMDAAPEREEERPTPDEAPAAMDAPALEEERPTEKEASPQEEGERSSEDVEPAARQQISGAEEDEAKPE